MALKTLLVLSTLSLTNALVGNTWTIASIPSKGLPDITFPFNMANASHDSGYYFAQQYNFQNVESVGYTGLQPRPDQNGNTIVHGVFSSFQEGTTSTHPNCHDGADSGPGVSCAVDIAGDYTHTYNCVVENIGDTTWRGTLVDTATHLTTIIGEWTLPSGAGGLKSSQVGFIEYYPWNDGQDHGCETLPRTEVFFGFPSSSLDKSGDIPRVYEYGGCEERAGFSSESVREGWQMEVGF